MLAPNIIIPFDGNHADIPAGFTRETAFDGRFPQGKDSGVGGTGGSDTHTHTTQGHTHSLDAHTHSTTFVDWTGPAGDRVNDASGGSVSTHGHNSANTSTTSTASSSSASPTLGSGSTLPPYYEVIYIKASGYGLVPANGLLFTQTSLDNLVYCDGGSGTPNLIGKFLRGAGTGQNAGATGGTTNHTHDATHGHTGASHTHTGTSGTRTLSNIRRSNQPPGGWALVAKDHTHTYTTGATTATMNDYSGNAGGDALIYPPYNTLKPYKNMSGGLVTLNEGAIALFTGATLPVGWILCDGTNGTPDLDSKFVLAGSTPGTTGGSLTHTHPNVSHTHISPSHSHTGATTGTTTQTNDPDGGSSSTLQANINHQHNLSTNSVVATYASSDLVIDADTSVPAYIEAKYIMATAAALGGGAGMILQEFM